ncbi:hypothetical protein Hdeb2414_s0008g00279561 [Helianthus debilis subsp. tardiflorus]
MSIFSSRWTIANQKYSFRMIEGYLLQKRLVCMISSKPPQLIFVLSSYTIEVGGRGLQLCVGEKQSIHINDNFFVPFRYNVIGTTSFIVFGFKETTR